MASRPVERFDNLPADSIHTVKEGSGTPANATPKKPQNRPLLVAATAKALSAMGVSVGVTLQS